MKVLVLVLCNERRLCFHLTFLRKLMFNLFCTSCRCLPTFVLCLLLTFPLSAGSSIQLRVTPLIILSRRSLGVLLLSVTCSHMYMLLLPSPHRSSLMLWSYCLWMDWAILLTVLAALVIPSDLAGVASWSFLDRFVSAFIEWREGWPWYLRQVGCFTLCLPTYTFRHTPRILQSLRRYKCVFHCRVAHHPQ